MSTAPLTEAARQLLRELPATVPVARIDRVWLFAPREVAGKESGLLVLSLLPEGEEDGSQRRVVTIRYEAERTRGRLRRTDTVAEQGSAPAERIPRLIEGVLRRLRDEAAEPVTHAIGGVPDRWHAWLATLGAAPVDQGSGE